MYLIPGEPTSRGGLKTHSNWRVEVNASEALGKAGARKVDSLQQALAIVRAELKAPKGIEVIDYRCTGYHGEFDGVPEEERPHSISLKDRPTIGWSHNRATKPTRKRVFEAVARFGSCGSIQCSDLYEIFGEAKVKEWRDDVSKTAEGYTLLPDDYVWSSKSCIITRAPGTIGKAKTAIRKKLAEKKAYDDNHFCRSLEGIEAAYLDPVWECLSPSFGRDGKAWGFGSGHSSFIEVIKLSELFKVRDKCREAGKDDFIKLHDKAWGEWLGDKGKGYCQPNYCYNDSDEEKAGAEADALKSYNELTKIFKEDFEFLDLVKK